MEQSDRLTLIGLLPWAVVYVTVLETSSPLTIVVEASRLLSASPSSRGRRPTPIPRSTRFRSTSGASL